MLIPGLGCSATIWNDIAAMLVPRYRVHLVQIAGFGSEPPRDNISGDICARVAAEMAEYISTQPSKQMSVVGHSVGGEIGLILAADSRSLVSRLMVVDAVPDFASLIIGRNSSPRQRRDATEQMVSQIINASPADFLAQETLTVRSLVLNADCQGLIIDQEMASDRGVLARCVRELMLTDLTDNLRRILIPTAVLYAWSPASPLSTTATNELFSKAYERLSTVKLQRIEPSGHFIFLDQPEQFRLALNALLASAPDAVRSNRRN